MGPPPYSSSIGTRANCSRPGALLGNMSEQLVLFFLSPIAYPPRIECDRGEGSKWASLGCHGRCWSLDVERCVERRYVATPAGDWPGGGVASDWRRDPANAAAGRTVAATSRAALVRWRELLARLRLDLTEVASVACLSTAQLGPAGLPTQVWVKLDPLR